MRGGNYNYRPPENRWSGVRNPPSHEQPYWSRMPPIPRRSSSTGGSPLQNGTQGTSQDPWLPHEESLTLRRDDPFSSVPILSPQHHHHHVHPDHVHIYVLDNALPRSTTFLRAAGLPLLPYSPPRFLPNLREQAAPSAADSKLTRDEQKEVMSKLRKETYNPPEWKRPTKPNYYIRDWAIISSRKEKEKDNEDGKRCAVCLEDFEPKEQVMLTPCSHMFHEDCIVPWVKSEGRCPVCRFAICERMGDVPMPRQGNGNADIARRDALLERELISVIRAMENAFEWD